MFLFYLFFPFLLSRRDLCCICFLLGLLLLPCSPDWFSISSFLFPPTASLVDLLSLCYSPYSSYPLPCSLCLALYALCYVLYAVTSPLAVLPKIQSLLKHPLSRTIFL
nr:MAG TPA: hypothetical protein [Inoviridae sp.]